MKEAPTRKPRKVGKRRTKDPCLRCRLNPNACLCDVIPSLDLATKITLAIHHYEIRRTSNTGLLALEALKNSSKIIRGQFGQKVNLHEHLSPSYQPLLLFPSDNAHALTKEYLANFTQPIELIVPDGNWRQAGKVHHRHTEINDVPRVSLPVPKRDFQRLRNKNSEQGMATLQAIAYALGIIEGKEVEKKLLDLFETKMERTLWARGVIPSDKCVTFKPGKRS